MEKVIRLIIEGAGNEFFTFHSWYLVPIKIWFKYLVYFLNWKRAETEESVSKR